MKKILCTFLTFLMFIFNTNLAFAVTNSTTDINLGTTVPISFVTSINSDNYRTSDLVPFYVTEDVYENKTLIFKKDSRGYATINRVIHSGGHGRGGLLVIQDAKLKDTFGNTHSLSLNINEQGESKRASAITLSVIGVLVILIPFGIWREGEPAILGGSKVFYAMVLN